LGVGTKALLREFDDKGSLVELFIEAGLERIEDDIGSADDFFRESSVEGHGPEF
jgi:hypothetical protein